MNAVRRASLFALGVAFLHLVFGAIVRISGSGMGCGNNWPKCNGYWFPPFSQPNLVIEVSHRYLASILVASVTLLTVVAWRARRTPGVAGRGGPMRTSLAALGTVLFAAILGAVTVKLDNAPFATVAHWLVAMTLLALVAATVIRASGQTEGRTRSGSRRMAQLLAGAAAVAITVVALGGVTAKYPNAGAGCLSFPLCGANPDVAASAVAVQWAHRLAAYSYAFYMIALVAWSRRRSGIESPSVMTAIRVALALVLLQVLIAGAMIGLKLPPVLRSAHEATGVALWLTTFVAAYLAHRTAEGGESASFAAAADAPLSTATIRA
jgi:cytochrome c oxidase assembly protein subunit 15